MSSPLSKICPLMSNGENIVYCNRDCAWFVNDTIPSMCMLKDISYTLYRIEHKLEDIQIMMPSDED